jgi:hypothetical protein
MGSNDMKTKQEKKLHAGKKLEAQKALRSVRQISITKPLDSPSPN